MGEDEIIAAGGWFRSRPEMEHKCYQCSKPADRQVRDVGLSHSMDIWVCPEHGTGTVLKWADPLVDVDKQIAKANYHLKYWQDRLEALQADRQALTQPSDTEERCLVEGCEEPPDHAFVKVTDEGVVHLYD